MLFMFIWISERAEAQCSYGTPTVYGPDAAPVVIGSTITSATMTSGSVYRVTGMVAGYTYRVYNCGSGFDTQITIYPQGGGSSLGYNDDNGPECTGTAASVEFVCPTSGSYDMLLSLYYCGTSGTAGTLTVKLTSTGSTLEGDNCSNAQNLASLTSPYNATTVGYASDLNVCQTGYPDRIFYIDVPDGYTVDIWQSANSYDSYHYMGYGGSCPGSTTLYCIDDPDTQHNPWTNSTGSTQTVYFIVDGYNGSGTFTLEWTLNAPPTCIAPTIPTTTSITLNGATLGWTSVDSFFDIFIQLDGLPAPDEFTTPTEDNWNSTSYTWSGGSSGTTYDWYVRTDCAAGGGTGQSDWSGPNTFTTLLVNDNCATATAISEVVDLAFSTVGSTQSGVNPGCGGSTNPYDIWYVYTASYSGSAVFDLCGSAFDTRLALYDMCGGTVLACNDDACGLSSDFFYTVTATTSYYVQVGGYNADVGTGYLSIAFEDTEWTGAAKSNDWNTAGNWTAGIPGSTTDVTIPAGLTNYPTLSSAGVCNTLYMGSNASLLDNGFLTLSTTTNGVTVERTISCDEAHSYSPSVSGATAALFHLPGSTGLDVYLYSHSEVNNATNGGYFNIVNLSTALVPMAGYAVFPDGLNATPPQTEWTFIQNGGLNTGAFGAADNMTRTGIGSFAGFNYMGNPYPSFMDWDAATGWAKTNMNATIWNERNGNWADYTAPGPGNNGGSNIIAPGQGFFVEVNGSFATGTVTMNNNVRTHTSTPYLKTVPTDYVQLRVTGSDKSDETVIRFDPNASLLFDGQYDGAKLMATDESYPQIYSVADRNLSYNALPETDWVQLGFFAGVDGEYNISIADISDISNVWLEDTFTGILTNLTADSYTFSHNVLNETDRFFLHFTPLAVPENIAGMINIYSSNHDIVVSVPANTTGLVKIYNLMGQETASASITDVVTRITLDKSAYYVVEVISDGSVVTKKVFVK